MHQLYVLALAAAAPLAQASATAARSALAFEEYVEAFGRTYAVGSAEYEQRRTLYEGRLKRIVEQNAKPGRLWTAGISHLTDQTEAELRQLRGYRRVSVSDASTAGFTALLSERTQRRGPPPATVDWGHLKTFASVPNQGGCGSCWAVTAATVLQAHHEIHVADNRSFSVQQLVNCVKNPHKCGGDGGCDGATVELAFDYAVKYGLSQDREVPYTGQNQHCEVDALVAGQHKGIKLHRHQSGGAFGLWGYSKLPENRALPLMHALVDGPVGISVSANSWSLYSTGIFNGCNKDAEIDHAVVLMGYGKDKKINYWNIQNSWGFSWGENGHIRLFRHPTAKEDEAFCGTDHDPKVGTACLPYPDAVEVCGMCGLLYDSVAPHFGSQDMARSPSLKLRGRARAK